MAPGTTNGWNEWSRHVLAELERLNGELRSTHGSLDRNKEDLNKKIDEKFQSVINKIDDLRNQMTKRYDDIKETVITLKVKVALIGGFAGLVVGSLVSLFFRLVTK